MVPQNVGWMNSPSNAKMKYLHRYATGRTALDLGCGRGWYASALADAGFQVTGIDQTNRVEDPRIQMLEREITAPLPFPDQAFDVVVMYDILEHLQDESGILREVSRVCRGRVIISVPHSDAGPLPIYGLTYLHYIDRTHVREYTPDRLRGVVEAFGFHTLLVTLEGSQTILLALAEFVRGGRVARQAARYLLTGLHRIGVFHNQQVAPDIIYVGERMGQN